MRAIEAPRFGGAEHANHCLVVLPQAPVNRGPDSKVTVWKVSNDRDAERLHLRDLDSAIQARLLTTPQYLVSVTFLLHTETS